MGGIGTEMARRARAFGMKILYCNRKRVEPVIETELQATYKPNLRDLLAESDVVTLHCPYSEQTHHLIGKAELEVMKPGSYIINTSRGKVIDTSALVDALKAHKLAGAGVYL